TLAPIALFIYNRPEHTQRTIMSLTSCKEFAHSPVYVFADGAKHANEIEDTKAARSVARNLLGDRATYSESAHNKGLAASVIDGVTDVCNQHGRVIVVE